MDGFHLAACRPHEPKDPVGLGCHKDCPARLHAEIEQLRKERNQGWHQAHTERIRADNLEAGEKNTMVDDQMISTFAMTRDPRLRRLFALVGRALDEGAIEYEWKFEDLLLDLAPEYLPPDDTDDPDLYSEWESFVTKALDDG